MVKEPSVRTKAPKSTHAQRNSLGEFQRIARLKTLFAAASQGAVKVGIGDDAAVLSRPKSDIVWTVDSSVQDVHFRNDWLTAQDIGWRSFHAAASDLAAMGAKPLGALSALELPRGYSELALMSLLRGQKEAAASLNCPVIGGNLARSSVLSVTTTVLGTCTRAMLRSGAKAGDEAWLIGDVGLAAAGLACLMNRTIRRRGTAIERCVEAWRRPVALIERGRELVKSASSAVDVSDGLVGDAQHIADASQVAIELDIDALERCASTELRGAAAALSRPAIELMLFGGEDYALFATGPARRRPSWARAIGRIVEGRGVWGKSKEQSRRRLRSGFDHFAA